MASNCRGNEVKHYLGIDPGKEGALAVLNDKGEWIQIEDMPGNVIDTIKLINWMPTISRAAIEQPFAGGKMGKPSCMSFGIAVGELRGVLASIGIPFHMVKPQDWQRVFGVVGKSKGNDSINQCLKLYSSAPLIEYNRKGEEVRKDGRSDALLIARWLWRQEQGR